MFALEVMNPVSQSEGETKTRGAARRPATLDGLTLGLLWNSKRGGEIALLKIGELAKRRFKNVRVNRYDGSMPFEKEILEKAKTECDVFVGSTGDCGSCASWLVHDLVEMEKAGKPAVGFFSAGFEKNAITTARAFGLPQFRPAVVPISLTGLAPEQIEKEATSVFDRIVEVLTTAPSAENEHVPRAVSREAHLRFEAPDSYAAVESMNRHFLEAEWGDGFPLIPPTPDRVARMLTGTTRKPDDVVTVMTPGNGLATVEKIAISAVMAGCEPAHLPILIAACRAFTDLGFQGRTLATSTSSHVPLMVINGPIAKEIGINSGRCALGPGLQSRHNIVLGRALRLIMINVGHARPGRMDMDTIGTARKFGMCVAENEDENPWSPFHQERGFDRAESTITLFATRDEIDVNDLGSWTPEGVLNSLAFYSAIPGGEYLVQVRPGEDPCYAHLLMMSPEHANIVGAAGWGKKAVREYIYQTCRISAKRLLNRCRNQPDKIRPHWQWLLKLSDTELDQMMFPVMENSNDVEILVVGGPTAKDMIYRCIARPVTTLIEDRA